MKYLSQKGFEIVVVDHHNPVVLEDKKTSVCPYVPWHINPYIEGMDGTLCAGQLCYELARFIHKDFENLIMPAIAGIADRCDTPETTEYIKRTGKEKEVLRKIGCAIDYISWNIRFDSGKGIYEELMEDQVLVDMLYERSENEIKRHVDALINAVQTEEFGNVRWNWIDLDKYLGRGYPPPGLVTGRIHDALIDENKATVTVGMLSDIGIFRATKPVIPVPTLVQELQKEMPHALVEGGGHECAGSIKFSLAYKEKFLEFIRKKLEKI
jgi:RecJ-like exonuclease